MYEEVQQRRGFELVRLERFADALPVLRESLSFDLTRETRSDALAGLGLCYLELEERELARDCFLQATELGLTKAWEGQVHFYLGITYFYLNCLRESKAQFQICEDRVAEYQLPISDIYAWLVTICKGLGEIPESEHYARLARPT